MERQLPHLTKRLQTTLDKLHNPEIAGHVVSLPVEEWWQDVLHRHTGQDIDCHNTVAPGQLVPATLFDSMLDNCVENALRKRRHQAGIRITVSLFEKHGAPALAVTDSGDRIAESTVRGLFIAPLPAVQGGGLGIGLFQVARQARLAGYEFSLTSNRTGEVCFRLCRVDLEPGAPGASESSHET
jgi:K+-sensing histidine kinase KdpD